MRTDIKKILNLLRIVTAIVCAGLWIAVLFLNSPYGEWLITEVTPPVAVIPTSPTQPTGSSTTVVQNPDGTKTWIVTVTQTLTLTAIPQAVVKRLSTVRQIDAVRELIGTIGYVWTVLTVIVWIAEYTLSRTRGLAEPTTEARNFLKGPHQTPKT